VCRKSSQLHGGRMGVILATGQGTQLYGAGGLGFVRPGVAGKAPTAIDQLMKCTALRAWRTASP